MRFLDRIIDAQYLALEQRVGVSIGDAGPFGRVGSVINVVASVGLIALGIALGPVEGGVFALMPVVGCMLAVLFVRTAVRVFRGDFLPGYGTTATPDAREIRVEVTDASDPVARQLLADYVRMRESDMPGYRAAPVDATAFRPPAGVFLVAYIDSRAAGCGGIRLLRPERAEIKHVWVEPWARRRGVARSLLAELEAEARRLRARELALDTNSRLDAAAALYKAAGFEPTEAYNDNPNADRWWRKDLAGTDQ